MALAFLGAAALLTAAEAAFSFLPRHDAEQAVQGSQGNALRRILDRADDAHARPALLADLVRMAAAVAVAVLLYSVLGNVWLAGLAATGIMAVLGFVLVGVSPRQLGRSTPAAVVHYSASLVRFLCVDTGSDPAAGWSGWAAPWHRARPAATTPSSVKRSSANWWTGPLNRT